jgi:hypothetical protein
VHISEVSIFTVLSLGSGVDAVHNAHILARENVEVTAGYILIRRRHTHTHTHLPTYIHKYIHASLFVPL